MLLFVTVEYSIDPYETVATAASVVQDIFLVLLVVGVAVVGATVRIGLPLSVAVVDAVAIHAISKT